MMVLEVLDGLLHATPDAGGLTYDGGRYGDLNVIIRYMVDTQTIINHNNENEIF
jgi:hypothetical protein